jgi:hypothetical protein
LIESIGLHMIELLHFEQIREINGATIICCRRELQPGVKIWVDLGPAHKQYDAFFRAQCCNNGYGKGLYYIQAQNGCEGTYLTQTMEKC